MRGINAEGGNETCRYENSNRHKIEDSDGQSEDGIPLFTDSPMEGRGKRYDCVENEPQDDPSRQAARGILSARSHWALSRKFIAAAKRHRVKVGDASSQLWKTRWRRIGHA
jgi:hypothetical protein